ncbi:uncharacterized protein LOC129596333 [Paramacrobiotus metropolitanus]|uniref:uncharacterized protein LOC129596333 n=1 Tax=Paramacrobiotus metropolitanus TaxID=2943436 RepID=UPI0024461FB1|nr:uncharacterized protein LOC129596333 [Paramacrobiotus metropolitanus]
MKPMWILLLLQYIGANSQDVQGSAAILANNSQSSNSGPTPEISSTILLGQAPEVRSGNSTPAVSASANLTSSNTSQVAALTNIAPSPTQKCGKDFFLKIINNQSYVQMTGKSDKDWELSTSHFHAFTTWFQSPQEETVDYLTSTVQFKDGPTVEPGAIHTQLSEASKRVIRTNFPTQKLHDGNLLLRTKFETIIATCVPESDLKTKTPESA